MEREFYISLKEALKLKGEENKIQEIKNRIDNIQGYLEIKRIAEDPSDELFVWSPSFIYNLFGYEKYRNCDLNIDSSNTYVLFRPNEEINLSVIEEIKKNHMKTQEYKYKFTPSLIASLYGGFPWFSSYYKICKELGIVNKEGYTFRITSDDGSNCVSKLVDIKNAYREHHPEETVKILFKDKKYDGVIHSFHSPNCIENKIHCLAIEHEIISGGKV